VRIKRLMDLMMDQNRALRVRGFMSYVTKSKQAAYIGIQRTPGIRSLLNHPCPVGSWLTENEATYVSSYSTSLNCLSEQDFSLIEEHGYQTARLTELGFPFL